MMNRLFVLMGLLFLGLFAVGCNEPKPVNGDNQNNGNELILYYGDTCPHCKNVEKYITDNNVDQKLKITQKEVYQNQTNAQEMVEKAKICGINVNNIGVPFLWNGAKCLSGDVDIIDYIKNESAK